MAVGLESVDSTFSIPYPYRRTFSCFLTIELPQNLAGDRGGRVGGDADGDGGRSGSRRSNSVGKGVLGKRKEGVALRGTWSWLYSRSLVSTTLVCRAINRNSFIPGDLYWIRLGGCGAWFSLKVPSCFFSFTFG